MTPFIGLTQALYYHGYQLNQTLGISLFVTELRIKNSTTKLNKQMTFQIGT